MLDPTEEAKHAKLREMCRELRVPPPPEIHIGLKVMDRNGVLVFDDKQRGHSWTRNYYNINYSTMATAHVGETATFSAGSLVCRYINGVIPALDRVAQIGGYNPTNTGFIQASAAADYGILVGTGDTAFSAEDYALAAKIAHGNGAGQLYYQAMAAATATYNSGTKTWANALSRLYNNNSGGSITVKEAGLGWYGTVGSLTFYLLERSVLSPTVTVAAGAQLTVTYTISMDFSAID